MLAPVKLGQPHFTACRDPFLTHISFLCISLLRVRLNSEDQCVRCLGPRAALCGPVGGAELEA